MIYKLEFIGEFRCLGSVQGELSRRDKRGWSGPLVPFSLRKKELAPQREISLQIPVHLIVPPLPIVEKDAILKNIEQKQGGTLE